MRYQLQPLFDQIVVKEHDPPDMRQSGLLVPQMHTERPPQEGTVVAVGGGQDWWAHAGFVMPVKPGDHVMFPWNAGVWIELNEERLLVLRAGQLLGIVDEVREHALSDATG